MDAKLTLKSDQYVCDNTKEYTFFAPVIRVAAIVDKGKSYALLR